MPHFHHQCSFPAVCRPPAIRFRTALTGAVLLVWIPLVQAGRVEVRAVDQINGEPVIEASLTLASAGRSESSDASGWIIIYDLEPGVYDGILGGIGYSSRRLRVELTGDEAVFREELFLTPQIHDLPSYEVRTSFLDSDQDAIDKRNAVAPIDQMSGEELHDVVDEHLGDTLSRVAGVNVDMEDGDVSGINIRGAGPAQTRITVDGQSMAGGKRGTTRGAGSMIKIPSEFLSRVRVMKAPTPDMDADAIGGTVDLQTSKIARTRDTKTTISARSGYYDASDTFNHRLDIAYAHPWSLGDPDRRFGILIAVNGSTSNLVSDDIQILNYWPKRTSPETGERIPVLAKLRAGMRSSNSDGYGIVVNTDLQLNKNNNFQLKGMWNDRVSTSLSSYNTIDFLRGKILSLTPVSGRFEGIRMEKLFSDMVRSSSSGHVVLAGDHRIGDWRIDESIGYSFARSVASDYQTGLFRSGAEFDGSYDMSGSYELPLVQITRDGTVLSPEDLLDPEPFRFSRNEHMNDFAEDKELAMRLNLLKRWKSGQASWLFKSGAKARVRDAVSDDEELSYSAKPGFRLTEVFAPAEAAIFRDLYPIGPTWSGDLMKEYFAANRDDFFTDPLVTLIDSFSSDYSVSESIYATYGMVQRESDKWTVIAGVRLERTVAETTGYETILQKVDGVDTVQINKLVMSNSYDMFFPGLHALYRPSSRWALRASLTRTMQRPDFRDLSPSIRVDLERQRIRAGNPKLKPFDAKAVDLGTDFVLNQYSSVSLGLFYKRIDHFIVDVQEETEYMGEKNFILAHPVNGSPADLYGIESYWSTDLPFLPDPLDDTSLSVSYTLTDSVAAYPGYPGENIMLPDQVRDNLSISLRWRYDNWSVSLRTRYHGLELDDIRKPGQDEFNAGYWSHSISISYKLNDTLSLSLAGSNLNRPDRVSFQGIPQQTTSNREGSRSFSIGLNFTFGKTPDTGKPSKGEPPPQQENDSDPSDS